MIKIPIWILLNIFNFSLLQIIIQGMPQVENFGENGNIHIQTGFPFQDIINQIIHNEDQNRDHEGESVESTTTIENGHKRTVTKTRGHGFESVIISESFTGGSNPQSGNSEPIRGNLRKINLSAGQNPFKVFHDLDSLFEGFLLNIASNIHKIEDQNETEEPVIDLKIGSEDNSDEAKSDDDSHLKIMNIRDVTNETNEVNFKIEKNNDEQEIKHIKLDEIKEEEDLENKKKEEKIEDTITIIKPKIHKSALTTAKILKYIVYVVLIFLAYFFGRIIFSKIGVKNEIQTQKEGDIQSVKQNINQTNIDTKSELKIIKEEKNKLY